MRLDLDRRIRQAVALPCEAVVRLLRLCDQAFGEAVGPALLMWDEVFPPRRGEQR